jgi:uncharacterized protein YbjT (DUF2867 family)
VEKHPTLKILALAFLILIGVMLVAEGLGQHVSKGYIYFAMAFSLVVEVVNMRVRKRRAGRAAGATRFVLNSSVGADPQSRSFYLRVKGEAEAALAGLGYATLALVRPSLLVAERSERRPGEAAAMKLAPLFNPLLVGPLGRYKAVDVATVARAMRGAARVISGRRVIEHGEILGLAAEA